MNKKLVLSSLLTFVASVVLAQNGIVEKKVFNLPSYTTVGGQKISNVSVGYETYGKLNANASNVIFIAHHYSGNSHAAGKYNEADKAAGYWDAVIGSGKAFDTDKFFIVSADTLSNLYPFAPNVHTTGPSSINPQTNKPYGSSFPKVTALDFVRVHRELLKSLGIKSLHTVAGASGGSMQAFQWAVEYPNFVKRVIAVITPGLSVVGTEAQKHLRSWAEPILQDPEYKNGAYESQPILGLSKSLAQTGYDTSINVDEKNNWSQTVFKTDWSLVIDQQKIDFAAPKMKIIDANNLVYTVRAYEDYNLESKASKIKAQVMMIPASSDKLFPPEMAERSRKILLASGVSVEPIFVLQGTGGHLDGVLQISQVNERVTHFMSKTVSGRGCKSVVMKSFN